VIGENGPRTDKLLEMGGSGLFGWGGSAARSPGVAILSSGRRKQCDVAPSPRGTVRRAVCTRAPAKASNGNSARPALRVWEHRGDLDDHSWCLGLQLRCEFTLAVFTARVHPDPTRADHSGTHHPFRDSRSSETTDGQVVLLGAEFFLSDVKRLSGRVLTAVADSPFSSLNGQNVSCRLSAMTCPWTCPWASVGRVRCNRGTLTGANTLVQNGCVFTAITSIDLTVTGANQITLVVTQTRSGTGSADLPSPEWR